MLVVLKIPVLFMIWLVFWASKGYDLPSPEDDSGGGPGCGGRPTPPVIDCGPRLRSGNKRLAKTGRQKSLKTYNN